MCLETLGRPTESGSVRIMNVVEFNIKVHV